MDPTKVSPNNKEVEEVSQEARNKCRDVISILPKADGWRVFNHLSQYQGFWYSPYFLEGALLAYEHFKAEPSDIILCSPQKTGTTWIKALSYAIITRSLHNFSTHPLLTKLSHECVPFLETCIVRSGLKVFPESPLIQTHLPYSFLPKSITSSKCKIVYICREPKDVFVSLWYHSCKRKQDGKEAIPLEEAFDLFCKGVHNYGPYWDNVLEYWNARLEHPERIMVLKYEELLRDTGSCVKRLAEFMGCPFSQEEMEGEDNVVQQIVELCSFKNLSNIEGHRAERLIVAENMGATIDKSVFFRKGEEGDWKNHFSAEMVERMDNLTEHKLRGSGFTFGV